jgi:hypothetical protein
MRWAAAAKPTGPAPIIATGNWVALFPFAVEFPFCDSNILLFIYFLLELDLGRRRYCVFIYIDGKAEKRTQISGDGRITLNRGKIRNRVFSCLRSAGDDRSVR